MRVLCIDFEKPLSSSWAEIFLTLSPRVHFRPPGFIFVEISTTSHLLGGEKEILKKARELSEGARVAIANSAYWAQVFCHYEGDHNRPLEAFRQMEGLSPWSQQKNQVELIIEFFYNLGFHQLSDVLELKVDDFVSRWGDLGRTLYNRLHQLEQQPISPLLNYEAFSGYGYLDFPAENLQFLIPAIRLEIERLCLRAQGRGRFFRRILISLHCEYSDISHAVEATPLKSSRDPEIFLSLISRKMEELDFNNPIRQFEITAFDVPEKSEQMDFFTPMNHSAESWQKLISLLELHPCESGFYKTPTSSWPSEPVQMQLSDNPSQLCIEDPPSWAMAPRPSLNLRTPEPLTEVDLSEIKILSRYPLERLERSWWDLPEQRDYYMARHPNGSLWWIYQDLLSKRFFLHGYFD